MTISSLPSSSNILNCDFEILRQIALYLPTADASAFARTCKRMWWAVDENMQQLVIAKLKTITSLSSVEIQRFAKDLHEKSYLRMIENYCPNIESLELKDIFKNDTEVIKFLLDLSRKREITHLSLPNCSLTYLSLKQIFRVLSNLEYCDLTGITLSDSKDLSFPEPVPPSVQSIILRNSPALKDIDLTSIGMHCKKVKELDLSNCTLITDDGLRTILEKIEGLRILNLSLLSLTDDSLTYIEEKKYTLIELNLNGCLHFSDTGLEALATSCEHLRKLHLSGCLNISVKGLKEMFPKGSELEFLDLSNCPNLEELELIRVLRAFPKLKNLNIAGCTKIGSQFLRALITRCPLLEELNLSNCPHVRADALEQLSSLEHLKTLILSGCCIKNNELMALEKCNLETIDLSNCMQLTDKALYYFLKNSSALQGFIANNSSVANTTLCSLATYCPLLTTLEIQECPGITNEGIEFLAPLIHLKSILLPEGIVIDPVTLSSKGITLTLKPAAKTKSYYAMCELM